MVISSSLNCKSNSHYPGIMNRVYRLSFVLIASIVSFSACTTTGVFEKNIPIPNHKWESNFQPIIDFDITDTTSSYNIYIVLRHTNKYSYNNIWVKAMVKGPGSDQWKSQQLDLLLATNDKGWLGSGMDDIFEHRVLVQQQTLKAGRYQYSIQQIMREDPLPEVMNVGLRIEKAP